MSSVYKNMRDGINSVRGGGSVALLKSEGFSSSGNNFQKSRQRERRKEGIPLDLYFINCITHMQVGKST